LSFIKKALLSVSLLCSVQCNNSPVQECRMTSVSHEYAACTDGRILGLVKNELRQVDSLLSDLTEIQKIEDGYLFGRKTQGASLICLSGSGSKCTTLEDGGLVTDIFVEGDSVYVTLESGHIFRGTKENLERFSLYSPGKEIHAEGLFLEQGFDDCKFIGYYGAVAEVCPDSVRSLTVDVSNGKSILGALPLADGRLFVYGHAVAKIFGKGLSSTSAPSESSQTIIDAVERGGKIVILDRGEKVQVLDARTLAVQKEMKLKKERRYLMNSTEHLIAISSSAEVEIVPFE
jgi:hypothetical protein